jgi:hypothetical protein
VALRRELHRVFRLNFTASTSPLPHHDGGIFAVSIARYYHVTTVQFLVTGSSVTCPWGSEIARCTQRGLFEATAGECDELYNFMSNGMNGDCIDEDNCK